MNNLVTTARAIPTSAATLAASYSPVVLSRPHGARPLPLRITAPVAGHRLPVVLLSHGHGPSLYIPSKDGYGPIAHFLAERGFAVIQPSHASAKVDGLPADAPGGPLFWRERAAEMTAILDGTADLEAAVPALAGRLDWTSVAVMGHSLGGHTAALLLGARSAAFPNESFADPRVTAGVLLAAPGLGGDALSETARRDYPALGLDFAGLTTRTLVVVGDADASAHLTTRGPAWHADAFREAPGADTLLAIAGGGHGLGGIAGYDAKETGDEDPDRLEATRRLVRAWLGAALGGDAAGWDAARAALAGPAADLARIEQR